MSSPANDDGDRRANRVPPWARDEQRYDDTRRLQDEIAAEVQRLKPSRASSPPDADFQTRHKDDGARVRRPGSGDEAARAARRSPAIDPVPLPAPPKLESRGSTWGMASRLVGAAVLSIVVTVSVMRSVWVPSADRSVTRDNSEAGAAGPLVAAAQENTKQLVASSQEKASQENTKQLVAALQENTKQSAVLPPANNAPEQQQPSSLSGADRQDRGERTLALARSLPVQQKPEAQQNDTRVNLKPKAQQNESEKLPPSAVPEPRVLDFLTREEIEALLRRGQDLIATGDIAGARLLLTRAAEAGDPRASLALAGTYDASVLASLGVLGVSPDAANARAWYAKAAEQGSPEAARRLKQLAAQ